MRSSLDPTLDIIFKILFARDAAQLIALLTAVLRPPEPITKVQVRNPDVAPAQANDKNIVLDILVELKDGTLLDVEMQAQKRAAFRERTLYYCVFRRTWTLESAWWTAGLSRSVATSAGLLVYLAWLNFDIVNLRGVIRCGLAS